MMMQERIEKQVKGVVERLDRIVAHVNVSDATTGEPLEFSMVSKSDLSNLGLGRGLLIINRDILAQRLKDNAVRGDQMKLLCAEINHIYRSGMWFEPSREMILEAILLKAARISADAGVPVIIFSKMQVADEDGINVVNPVTGFQLCLTGNTDYGLCTYKKESQQSFMLTAADDSATKFAHDCVTLVVDKSEREQLYDNMPEAFSQAIALSEQKKKKVVRFCISDGLNWVFAILATDEHGNRVGYQGELFSIIKPEPEIQEEFEDSVRQIVALVHHWLTANDEPFSDPLCTLEPI